MTEFPAKDYWKIYLNDEAKERVKEIQDHLDNTYDNRSQYLREKLFNEETLSIEERIKKLEEEKKDLEGNLEKLKRIKNEREMQDKLKDKKELLRSKQEKLDEIRDEGVKSFHEVMMDEIQMREKSGHDCSDPGIARMVLDRAERKMDKQPDVDELVEDVERLQDEVAELNGGREDWFLELEAVEVSA